MAVRQWVSLVVWIGILVNLLFAVPALFRPEAALAFLGLGPATPLVWLRWSGLLLAMLSMLYVPAALDPDRYRTIAWLATAVRFAGAAFFLGQIITRHLPGAFLPMGATDLGFGVLQALLLARAKDRVARSA
jgi:hypothetical protein